MFSSRLARIIYTLRYARQLLRKLPAFPDPHSAGGGDCDCHYHAFLADWAAETDSGEDVSVRIGVHPGGRPRGGFLGEFFSGGAVILHHLKNFGLLEMFVYIGIVLVGFFYVWKKGVLDWGPEVVRRGT